MTTKQLAAVMLLLDANRGTYIPRDFLTDNAGAVDPIHCAKWGLTEANRSQWESAVNPDDEWYFEAWQWILDNAAFTDETGGIYTLHQDGDLWALCIDRMTDEEKLNFGFDED